MIVVGVDPGAETGLVALDVPPSRQVADSLWLGHAVFRSTEKQGLSHPERDANLYDRLVEWFRHWQADVVVFEEPVDAATIWRGHRFQQRGTAFRLGAFYGLVVAAARQGSPSYVRLASYPVTNHNGRPGWMRGKKHDTILSNMQAVAQLIRPDLDPAEHVLMALGVVTHHLSQVTP